MTVEKYGHCRQTRGKDYTGWLEVCVAFRDDGVELVDVDTSVGSLLDYEDCPPVHCRRDARQVSSQ
jgi:hypothetical protein